MYPDGEVDNLHCGDCKYFRHDIPGKSTPCRKRIDHVKIRFATPWFQCYDCNQYSGVICSDFEPSGWYKFLASTWKGFDYYWPRFVEQWQPLRYVAFILDGNKAVRYHVKLEDFVFGTMFDEDGRLKAYERQFYLKSRASPIGSVLMTEVWNPETKRFERRTG